MSVEERGCSPSQTVGPFFHFGLTGNTALGCLAGDDAAGERIRLHIRMLDGDGLAVSDGMIELWQANAEGNYDDPRFCGFGRLETDADGVCVFDTIRPGAVAPDGAAHVTAAHINISVFARGLLARLCTRIYFADDPALDADPILSLVPPARRSTLIAQREGDMWVFEIRLQGERETVFFDL